MFDYTIALELTALRRQPYHAIYEVCNMALRTATCDEDDMPLARKGKALASTRSSAPCACGTPMGTSTRLCYSQMRRRKPRVNTAVFFIWAISMPSHSSARTVFLPLATQSCIRLTFHCPAQVDCAPADRVIPHPIAPPRISTRHWARSSADAKRATWPCALRRATRTTYR